MSKFRTPLKNARGLGSSKSGTEHFIHQRLTATALVALTIWFLCLVLSLIGADYVTAVETVSKPWNAIRLVAFLVAMFSNAQLGLQVVLADYIDHSLMAMALQTTVKFIAVHGAIVSIFAVARMALGN